MSEDLRIDRPSNVFRDVRFLLLGFDPVRRPQVLSKLVSGGGVDAVRYGPDCTHVIVDKLLYDDPSCVAARNDGKALVTGLWVAHSLDLGMPVDTTSIMYKPVRDLKGIPGAKSLVVCLTGYQRQDREDIMTMVGLMGANFSKPLIANKVTHLICYKFEGDKYELAKRTKKIKILNQLWLEDCLKAWKILPEADYTKSGYELDILEAEVKDSEEADVTSKEYKLLNPTQGSIRNQLDPSASRDLSDLRLNGITSASGKQRISDQERSKDPHLSIVFGSPDCSALKDAKCGQAVELYERTTVPTIVGNHLAATTGNERSPKSEAIKYSARTYSRKTRQTAFSGKGTGDMSTDSTVNRGKFNDNCGIPVVLEHLKDKSDIVCSESPFNGVLLQHGERNATLDENVKLDVSYGSPELKKTGENSKPGISEGLQEANRKELLEDPSLTSGHNETDDRLLSNSHPHYTSLTASLSIPRRSSARISRLVSSSSGMKSSEVGTPISETVNSETSKQARSEEALKINSKESKKDSLQSKPKNEDTLNRQEHFSGEILSSRSQLLGIEKLKGSDRSHADAHSKPPTTTRKMCDKKTCSEGNTTTLKGTVYLSKCMSRDNPVISSIRVEKTANYDRLAVVPPEVNHTDSRAETEDVQQARNEVQEKFTLMDDEKFASMDDETEAPVDNEDNIMEAVSEEKTGEGDNSNDQVTNETDGLTSGVHLTTSGNDKGGSKQQKVNYGKRKVGESTHQQKPVMENVNRRKKCSLNKTEKNVDPSKAPEVKKVSEPVIKENYDEVESEIVGKQLEVHCLKTNDEDNLKTNDEDKDSTKKKKEKTCGKRKLARSADLEKAVKLNLSKGKISTRSKIVKTTISSETLEVKGKNEFNVESCEENDGESELGIAVNLVAGDKSEDMQTPKTDYDALVHSNKTSGLKKDGSKQNKSTCSKRELRTCTNVETASENINGGQKHLLPRFRKEKRLAITKLAVNAEAKAGNNEAEVIDKMTKSVENEQKNKLNCVGDQNVSHGKNKVRKLASKKLSSEESKLRLQVQKDSKPEPVCFIVSGHKQQRKEFQQVIRRLKGKVCKDSHQWSYQATHFIAPDPIRRTEKFFAAAASGRWILKADYISDSSKEGKLLAEEPYEWHKSGLSEDGSINLEAPRKWRIQRERTGHGAFYGMRIVIYGECIAPSLDTLKRVVKAGDGTILATSPPYTRFLESGVDYAVVCPSTPHTDIWVQEFSRHEIPCVLADYLVDFVCKPGYSLEKHVRFNTHAWAEKSYTNLVNKSETNSELMTPPPDGSDFNLHCPEVTRLSNGRSDNDLPCQVCGSRDRGEEMLICGHENNSNGCGIGMHIDCCDPPPMPNVPKEKWLCSECSKSKSKKRTPKCAEKRAPVSKRKK